MPVPPDQLPSVEPYCSLPDEELLSRVQPPFPPEFWTRYRQLVARRWDGTLTPEEQQELIGFSDRTEEFGLVRLHCIIELARRSGVTLEAVMQRYDLRPVSLEAHEAAD